MAFPTTSVLDDFNRADAGPPPSASWTSTGTYDPSSGLKVLTNQCATDGSNKGGVWGTQYGPDCEQFSTVATLFADARNIQIHVRMTLPGTGGTGNSYFVRFTRNDLNAGFDAQCYRDDAGSWTQLGATVSDTAGALAGGVKFGVDMIGSTLSGYVNRSGTWASAISQSDATYSNSGYLSLRPGADASVRFDDFGGGTVFVPGASWVPASARVQYT